MSNKILFLYINSRQKVEFEKCEKVLKAVFRKFRKSAVLSYLQADLSASCIHLFKEKLYEEIQKNDAVFISGDIPREDKSVILQKLLEEYAEAHFMKGCVICHPPSSFAVAECDGKVVCTHTVKSEDFSKAVNVANSLSLKRKRRLTVCTEESTGKFLEKAVFESFDKSLHIEKEKLSFEEALLICMNSVPAFDVVITTEQSTNAMKMHIGFAGASCIPDGYSVIYTEKGNVYTRHTFPYEQMDNTPLFSALIAFSSMLENEFSMTNAAEWLKKAATVSFETHRRAEADDYITKVISEIEKPMRKYTR